MTREDIIRMAREAELEDGWLGWCQECGCDSEKLERFAALVAKHTLANIDPRSFMSWQEGYAAGATAEREACAKVALAADDQGSVNQRLMQKRIATAIRARGNT